jgi:hypothetical protein
MNPDLCTIDVVAQGLRFSGAVFGPKKSTSTAIAARLIDYFENNDFGAAASAPEVAPGTWQASVSCDALSPLELGGNSYDLTLDILGSDGGSLPLQDQLDQLFSSTGCVAFPAGSEGSHALFTVRAAPGGAWQYDEALDTLDSDGTPSEPATVSGFGPAAQVVVGGRTQYFLVSGPNYLEITISGDIDADELIPAIMTKLR